MINHVDLNCLIKCLKMLSLMTGDLVILKGSGIVEKLPIPFDGKFKA